MKTRPLFALLALLFAALLLSGAAVDSQHDTTVCHGAETGDGHTHGFCVEDLPPGPIRTFLEENPLFAGVGQPWLSSEHENGYPFPMGKHEGYKHLFQEFEQCRQFTGTPTNEDFACVKAIWLQPHTMGTAHEIRVSGSAHSLTFVAEICTDETFTDCGIVAGGEIERYGEVHAQYKQTGCPGIEGGVYYPPRHTVSQPPYVAVNAQRSDFFSRPARIFWSSLRNATMEPYAGDVNNLIQVAFAENAFEVTSSSAATCAHHEHDRVWAHSTNDGFINQYAIWTIKIMIEDYPRPFSGYTDREGNLDTSCTEPGFACIPLFISETAPVIDAFFNLPVSNDTFSTPEGVIDITEPNVFMPGHAP